MRALGAEIQLLAAHIPQIGDIPTPYKPLAEETKSIFPIYVRVSIKEHLAALFTRPAKYFRSLRVALTADQQLSFKDRMRTLSHWAQAPLLHRLCRENGVTHVHVHFLNSPASVMLFVNIIYDTSYTVTAHGSDIFVEKILQEEKISHSLFTRVMTNFNRDTLSKTEPGGDTIRDKLCVIPIGIGMAPISERTPRGEVFTFLHVGRMVWQKGQRLLLEACNELRKRGCSFELIFVGDGELGAKISNSITELNLQDRVRLLGALPKEEVIDLYRSCDCFVLSSLSEGSPAVLAEAMSEALPVIAPSLHGIPEMFEHGRAGWLFETGNVGSLANSMVQAMTDRDRLELMGNYACQQARNQFDLQANTKFFHSVLMGAIVRSAATSAAPLG